MNTSQVEHVTRELRSYETQLRELSTLLAAERAALSVRHVDELATLAEEKALLCDTLSKALAAATPDALLQSVSSPIPTELELVHKTVMELADEVRDSNLVNGKILARSQQSTRELLTLLSGRDLEGLYGTSGQTDTSDALGAHEIAKA